MGEWSAGWLALLVLSCPDTKHNSSEWFFTSAIKFNLLPFGYYLSFYSSFRMVSACCWIYDIPVWHNVREERVTGCAESVNAVWWMGPCRFFWGLSGSSNDRNGFLIAMASGHSPEWLTAMIDQGQFTHHSVDVTSAPDRTTMPNSFNTPPEREPIIQNLIIYSNYTIAYCRLFKTWNFF